VRKAHVAPVTLQGSKRFYKYKWRFNKTGCNNVTWTCTRKIKIDETSKYTNHSKWKVISKSMFIDDALAYKCTQNEINRDIIVTLIFNNRLNLHRQNVKINSWYHVKVDMSRQSQCKQMLSWLEFASKCTRAFSQNMQIWSLLFRYYDQHCFHNSI
jgi:hypothetical protein